MVAFHSCWSLLSKVKIISTEEWNEWWEKGKKGEERDLSLPPAERGAKLAQAKGCNACHSSDGSIIIGPSYNDEKILSYGSFDLSKNLNEFDKFHLKEVDWVVGCTMLLDTKKINENFYFDENFFLYFEEADLCRRIKLKGGRVYTSSKLLVDHYGHKGSAATDPKYSIETEMFRNWHWMWSSFYYKRKYSNYLIALGSMFGKLARSFIKMIFFTIVYNKKKQTMYYARFAGLINSMLGKKSWYRVKSLFD